MLDNLHGFLQALEANMTKDNSYSDTWGLRNDIFTGDIFCPTCGDRRRVEVKFVYNSNRPSHLHDFIENIQSNLDVLPLVFISTCFQCQSKTSIIIYKSPNGAELVLLHDTYSGCITPSTPDEIKFYLDQAFRAKSVGATSAAATMYRSALEWVLYEQGFKTGMLKAKITSLIKAINNDTAPIWTKNFDVEYLDVIKEIGNSSAHTNDGDITKQHEIDIELLAVIDELFAELLDKIYEQPAREAQRKSALLTKKSRLQK